MFSAKIIVREKKCAANFTNLNREKLSREIRNMAKQIVKEKKLSREIRNMAKQIFWKKNSQNKFCEKKTFLPTHWFRFTDSTLYSLWQNKSFLEESLTVWHTWHVLLWPVSNTASQQENKQSSYFVLWTRHQRRTIILCV